MRLVMLGLPAAGKGTHGKLLAQRFAIPHISTGSMFRAAMQLDNDLGRRAKWYIDRGELVPDGLAAEIVKERLSQEDCRHGFILDGFPRTVTQAEDLDAALRSIQMAVDAAINIQISEEEAIRRIANRKVCGQCGSTGNPAPLRPASSVEGPWCNDQMTPLRWLVIVSRCIWSRHNQ
jgi:adenylate kinase